MNRTPLENGCVLISPKNSYIINKCIGKGATSIAYSARYDGTEEGKEHVIIKECFPAKRNVRRENSALLWDDETNKQQDITAFSKVYNRLYEFQSIEGLINKTSRVIELFSENETFYSVMLVNEGETFKERNFESLTDIFKAVKSLCEVVKQYHELGYLHLDIKPENFFIINETSELVKLFDLDSVTKISDLVEGKQQCISYSEHYAAPEQKQGLIDQLCFSTDIFSIGATLFEKIMNRTITIDDSLIFADWEFTDEKFLGINPKVKRLLKDIFHKTLSVNIKRRYQNVTELIAVIDELIAASRENQYIISNYILPEINFVGREQELKEIERIFASGENTVIIHGQGGMGKTELAKQYLLRNIKKYDAIIFEPYVANLQQTITRIKVFNNKEETNLNLLNILCRKSKVLIIIDNYDVKYDKDMARLCATAADVIFTTRNDFTMHSASFKSKIVEVNRLNDDDAFLVFKNEYDAPITSEEVDVIKKINSYFGNLTMLIPIVAKQIAFSRMSPFDFYEKIKQDGLKSFDETTENVSHIKDEEYLEETILGYLRYLNNLDSITDEHRTVLRNLYFLKDIIDLSIDDYITYTCSTNSNHLKELIFLNWVQYNKASEVIIVHQTVKDLIESDLEISKETVPGIFSFATQEFDRLEKYSKISDAYNISLAMLFYDRFEKTVFEEEKNYYKIAKFIYNHIFENKEKMYELLFSEHEKSYFIMNMPPVIDKIIASVLNDEIDKSEDFDNTGLIIFYATLVIAIKAFYAYYEDPKDVPVELIEKIESLYDEYMSALDLTKRENLAENMGFMAILMSVITEIRMPPWYDADGNVIRYNPDVIFYGGYMFSIRMYIYSIFEIQKLIAYINYLSQDDMKQIIQMFDYPKSLKVRKNFNEWANCLNELIMGFEEKINRFWFWTSDKHKLMDYDLKHAVYLYNNRKYCDVNTAVVTWNESVNRVLREYTEPYPIYKLLLDMGFHSEYIFVRKKTKTLLSNMLFVKVAEDYRLTQEQKDELLYFNSAKQIRKHVFNKENATEQEKNTYSLFRPFYSEYLHKDMGKLNNMERISFDKRLDVYAAMLVLDRHKTDAIDVSELLEDDIQAENIQAICEILKIIDFVTSREKRWSLRQKAFELIFEMDLSILSKITLLELKLLVKPNVRRYKLYDLWGAINEEINANYEYYLNLLDSTEISNDIKRYISEGFVELYIETAAIDFYNKHCAPIITTPNWKSVEKMFSEYKDSIFEFCSEQEKEMIFGENELMRPFVNEYHLVPYWVAQLYNNQYSKQVNLGISLMNAETYEPTDDPPPLPISVNSWIHGNWYRLSANEIKEGIAKLIELCPEAKEEIKQQIKP